MSEELTPLQQEVLYTITEFYRTYGRSITTRELKAILGVASEATVQQRINALRRKGYLPPNTRPGCPGSLMPMYALAIARLSHAEAVSLCRLLQDVAAALPEGPVRARVDAWRLRLGDPGYDLTAADGRE